MPHKSFQNIPTNIITGFLGSGKTTVIRQLLKQKPADEKWAVLVNEFGEVGIDGALFNSDGIAVKEVPGGCMCCSVGLPSRTALNNLIRNQNPDRILIEPTGLAHPAQVLGMLSGKEYQGVLELRAVVCLLDPWTISEPRFLELPAFHQQIELADVLVGSKKDTAQPEHLAAFQAFADKQHKTATAIISHGELPLTMLDITHSSQQPDSPVTHAHGHYSTNPQLPEADSEGVIRIENASDHDQSVGCGWIFSADWLFDNDQLQQWITQLSVPRIKGVFATETGWYAINKIRQHVSCEVIEQADESRVEMINLEKIDWLTIDAELRECRETSTRNTQ